MVHGRRTFDRIGQQTAEIDSLRIRLPRTGLTVAGKYLSEWGIKEAHHFAFTPETDMDRDILREFSESRSPEENSLVLCYHKSGFKSFRGTDAGISFEYDSSHAGEQMDGKNLSQFHVQNARNRAEKYLLNFDEFLDSRGYSL